MLSQWQSDFTKINGIGKQRQQILRDGGIITYADLAEASTDYLLQLFKDYGSSIPSINQIETWKSEARNLAKQEKTTSQKWLKGFAVEFSVKGEGTHHSLREVNVCDLNITEAGDWQVNGKEPLLTFSEGNEVDLFQWMISHDVLAGWGGNREVSATLIKDESDVESSLQEPTDTMSAEEGGLVGQQAESSRVELNLEVESLELKQGDKSSVYQKDVFKFAPSVRFMSQSPILITMKFSVPELLNLSQLPDSEADYAVRFFVKDDSGRRYLGETQLGAFVCGQTGYSVDVEVLLLNGWNEIGFFATILGEHVKMSHLKLPHLMVT